MLAVTARLCHSRDLHITLCGFFKKETKLKFAGLEGFNVFGLWIELKIEGGETLFYYIVTRTEKCLYIFDKGINLIEIQ